MKLVVTGALGHIGSAYLRDIERHYRRSPAPVQVTLIDNMSAQRYCSLFGLPEGVKYRFIEADVTQVNLGSLVEHADAVIHLAAMTNAAESFANRKVVEKANFNATACVAEACAKYRVSLFYASTTSIYGTQSERVDENCTKDDLKPQSPYAETKLREEKFLRELGQTKDLRFVIARLGTIFGASPGMRFHTAVNKFCWQAALGVPVTVWRTALNQVRPYLDLEDAIAAIHFIVDHHLFDQEIYNILTLNATVAQILDAIRVYVPNLQVNLVDAEIMNQLSYHVANEKFQSKGFVFNGDLKRGIADTLNLLHNARYGA